MEISIEDKYSRDINCLHDRDKNIRFAALGRLTSGLTSDNQSDVQSFFASRLKPALLEIFKDASDRNKEKAVDLTLLLLKDQKILEDDIQHIIHVLHDRLGHDPCPESCEEVRLKELKILKHISESFLNILPPLMSEITDIISKQAKDRNPDAKIAIAQIIEVLALYGNNRLGFHARKIYEGLRANLSHQQFKVRLPTIKALGKLLLCEGAHSLLEETYHELKLRQTDGKPEVREQLYVMLSALLVNLPYSFLRNVEGKLCYLLLGGLADPECNGIYDLIVQAGQRRRVAAEEYKENIEDIVFAEGAEFLVLKNLQELVQFVLADIQEWTIKDTYRSKAVAVLISIVEGSKNHVMPHLELIFKVIFKAYAQSEDKEYSALFESCIQKIGIYCDFGILLSLFSKFCLTDMSSPTEKAGGLILFAKMLQSVNLTEDQLPQLVNFCTNQDLATSEHAQITVSLQLILETLIYKAGSLCTAYVEKLFYTLLLLENSAAKQGAVKTMELLAECCGLISVSELYAMQLPTALPTLITNYKNWDANSNNRVWFRTLILKAGSAVSKYFETIIAVLSENSQREKESEVRYDMLVVLDHLLNVGELDSLIKSYARKLLESVIVPTAAWKVGMSNIQIRVSSMICLDKLILKRLIDDQVFIDTWDKVFPVIKTCLDDDWDQDLRISACKVMAGFFIGYSQILDDILISGIYPELLKRLDDSQDRIRILVCEPLKNFFDVLMRRSIRFGNYKYTITTLLIHLDDPSEIIQQAVKSVLEVACLYDKNTFLEIATEIHNKHRHPRAVSELIERAQHFQNPVSI